VVIDCPDDIEVVIESFVVVIDGAFSLIVELLGWQSCFRGVRC